jgi:hypothetical protein
MLTYFDRSFRPEQYFMTRKLPVWQVIRKSLRLVWERRSFALWISWPFVALSIAIIAIMASLGFSQTNVSSASSGGWAGIGREFVVTGVKIFFLSILAVFWHRNVLLHETRAPALPVRIDGFVWRYVGYAVAFGIAVFVIVFAAIMSAMAVSSLGELGQILGAGLVLVLVGLGLFLALFRLSLVFPAAAVGNRAFGLRQSWRVTRGNAWRLLLVQVLTFAVGFAIGVVVGFVGGFLTGVTQRVIGEAAIWFQLVANTISGWLAGLVALGVISVIYAYLVDKVSFEDSAPQA